MLLLREVSEGTGLIRRFAACFTDHRRADRIEHTVEELLGQRVLGQALGYEDLNDHDTLRDDPLLALAAGKRDLRGERRLRERDRVSVSTSTIELPDIFTAADSSTRTLNVNRIPL